MQDHKDKLVLDLTDDESLAEHFSRKGPGDKCTLRIEATLDENHEGMAVLSVTHVTGYENGKGDAPAGDAAEAEQPAVKVAKRRKAAEMEGGY